MIDWTITLANFKAYLALERSFSINSISAYLSDLEKFSHFITTQYKGLLTFADIKLAHCEAYLIWLHDLGISTSSQARFIASLKAFFRFLILEETIPNNPVQLLESPRLSQKIPAVLSLSEIQALLAAIDQSKPLGVRNKAILETLYACGLRVSEVIKLKISGLYLTHGFIKVRGKGNKERLVPINESATKQITIYQKEIRAKGKIGGGHEDTLFLNNRGNPLSRVMIFHIIKNLVKEIGLEKTVSPHTFRHSFATHLYENGADLRAIQQMLGHESITTTEIYTKVNGKYLRDVLIKFHPRFNE